MKSDITWSHFEKQSESEVQIEELGYQLVFEKNKSNNQLMDQLIREKSHNMKLFDKKKMVDSKVYSILQHNYEEISILKKQKQNLLRECDEEASRLSKPHQKKTAICSRSTTRSSASIFRR